LRFGGFGEPEGLAMDVATGVAPHEKLLLQLVADAGMERLNQVVCNTQPE
jgi:hypothetical protein